MADKEIAAIARLVYGGERDAFQVLRDHADQTGDMQYLHALAETSPAYYFALHHGFSAPNTGLQDEMVRHFKAWGSNLNGLEEPYAKSLCWALYEFLDQEVQICQGDLSVLYDRGQERIALCFREMPGYVENSLQWLALADTKSIDIVKGGQVHRFTVPLVYRLARALNPQLPSTIAYLAPRLDEVVDRIRADIAEMLAARVAQFCAESDAETPIDKLREEYWDSLGAEEMQEDLVRITEGLVTYYREASGEPEPIAPPPVAEDEEGAVAEGTAA